MAFTMPKLKRLKSGAFSARKVIPADVRGRYGEQFGGGWEERFHAPAGTSLGEAKRATSEWLAEIERRIAAIRDDAAGKGRSLTPREALALAGEWYRWFIARHEDEPGDPEGWGELLNDVQSRLLECAPDWFRRDEGIDPDWKWTAGEEVRTHMRPVIADDTAQFLVSRGLALSPEARDRFLDAVETELAAALKLIIKRAEGDYTPDARPQRFPAFVPTAPGAGSGQSCFALFEAWVKATGPRPSTVTRWSAVFLDLQAHFADRSAASITNDDARAWKDRLITDQRGPATVRDIWIVAARTVFGWALKEHSIPANSFVGITVRVSKKTRLRETDAFTAEEAATILKAALAITRA